MNSGSDLRIFPERFLASLGDLVKSLRHISVIPARRIESGAEQNRTFNILNHYHPTLPSPVEGEGKWGFRWKLAIIFLSNFLVQPETYRLARAIAEKSTRK